MLKIKQRNLNVAGRIFDYELENDVLLHPCEWNGHNYKTYIDGIHDNQHKIIYIPVYHMDKKQGGAMEIVGFSALK